jgi:hypothetical protein
MLNRKKIRTVNYYELWRECDENVNFVAVFTNIQPVAFSYGPDDWGSILDNCSLPDLTDSLTY